MDTRHAAAATLARRPRIRSSHAYETARAERSSDPASFRTVEKRIIEVSTIRATTIQAVP